MSAGENPSASGSDAAEAARHRARIREQFNRQADAYSENTVVIDGGILGLVTALVDAKPTERVLDVACGPAYLTLALAEKARLSVGLDVTDRLLARARAGASRRGLKNAAFVQADVESFPFAAESFDVSTCKFALHHFLHPGKVLAEMRRVTRPGGRVVLLDMTTSEDPAQAAYHQRIEKLCDPTHVRALPGSELDSLIAAAGLRVATRRLGTATNQVPEWLAHGGPAPEAAAEIERLLRDSITEDRSGLAVREENGTLLFEHTGLTYLLERP